MITSLPNAPVRAALAALALGAAALRAADAPVSFSREIAPILSEKCAACHQPGKAKGRYLTTSFQGTITAGASEEPAVVAGKPERSALVRRLKAADPDDRMPQKDDPLPPAQIALFERWVREGAVFDGSDPRAPLSEILPPARHPAAPPVYAQPVPVTAVSFPGTNGMILAGGYHEVFLLDPGTGTTARRIGNLPQRIHAILPLPGGERMIVAGGSPGKSGEVREVSVQGNAVTRVLARSADVILALAASADGRWVAAGGVDQSIRLIDLAAGRVVRTIDQHSDWVTALAFDPASPRLASASRDKSSRVFTVPEGELASSYPDSPEPLQAVTFTEDGAAVWCGGRGRTVTVWDPREGKKTGALEGLPEEVLSMCLAKDRIHLLMHGGRVREHAVSGSRELVRERQAEGARLTSLALDPRGTTLAAGAADGAVWTWDLRSATNAPVRIQVQPLK